MFAIFKRELRAYFTSPIAYVFMTGFFALAGIFFLAIELSSYGSTGRFNSVLDNMKLVLLFMIPALTMKLIAEDKKTKVDALLFTSPVRTCSIVLGKFFAATVVFLITIVISLVYPIILSIVSHVPVAEVLNSYIGYTVLGISFISICIFASSLTENQVIAFIIGFSMILLLWILEFTQSFIQSAIITEVIKWLSLLRRYDEISGGIFKLAPIVYYVSVIVLFLFLTIRVIEKRRWSQG